MIVLDLPGLQSIQLGEWTLYGKEDNDLCSLTMRSMKEIMKHLLDLDLPRLTSIISVGNSFCSPRLLTLESSG